MDKKVEKVINEWDPLELFPFAPADEYKREIQKIILVIEKDKNILPDSLAARIKDIFINAFDETIISVSDEKYIELAHSILA